MGREGKDLSDLQYPDDDVFVKSTRKSCHCLKASNY